MSYEYITGLGAVGPKQAWTSQTAGRAITEATETCPSQYKRRRLSEYSTPKKQAGGEVVDDTGCIKTGKIYESKRLGGPRLVEWCCEVQQFKPRRALTQEEFSMWEGTCQPVQDARGLVYETIPSWEDPEKVVKDPCARTSILDDGYELVCCPVPGSKPTLTRQDVKFARAAPTEEQEAQWEARKQQVELEREQKRQAAALAPATVIDRYGLPILLVGGVVGLGVTAALFKRFSAATKAAKQSEKSRKV